MFRYFENLVDPYCDYPETDTPPQKLWPFLKEYCRPFTKVFAVTAFMSVVVAAIEIWLIAYLGRIVDILVASDPGSSWSDQQP